MTDSIFPAWGKTPRLEKLFMTITEKIDGTNGVIEISPLVNAEDAAANANPTKIFFMTDPQLQRGVNIRAGSRTRWLNPHHPKEDNFGFARWAFDNAFALAGLGTGKYYGEWWGSGIGRRYDMKEKVFSLFNTRRPPETLPACVRQVPLMYNGAVDLAQVNQSMDLLRARGSLAAPGFMQPEGVIVWLQGERFKVTFEAGPKGEAA